MNDLPDDTIDSKYMSITALWPYSIYTSPSRLLMANSQAGQRMININPERAIINSGLEKDFAKHTFNKKIPYDCKVVSIIRRSTGNENSLVTIIFSSLEEPHKINEISVPSHFGMHSKFGFEYKLSRELLNLDIGSVLEKDVILADSVAVEDAFYKTGVHLNTVIMSKESTAEDSIEYNSETVGKLAYNVFPTITIDVGHLDIPLNKYGDENNYKCFPEPGDVIRPDGVIMATRRIEEYKVPGQSSGKVITEDMLPALYNIKSLSEEKFSDNRYQLQDMAGAVVDSVKVVRYKNRPSSYEGIHTEQLDRFADQNDDYYKNVLRTYRSLKRQHNNNIELSVNLSNLVHRALMLIEKSGKPGGVKLIHKQEDLPPYSVEIVLKKKVIPTLGGKTVDRSSAKSVITKLTPPEDMPTTKDGVVADVVVSVEATPNRMIVGRDAEQYVTGAAFVAHKKIHDILKLKSRHSETLMREEVKGMILNKTPQVQQAFDVLLMYYDMVSKPMSDIIRQDIEEMNIDELVKELVDSLIHKPIGPQPAEYLAKNPIWKTIKKISKSELAPTLAPVTYRGANGKMITTKEDVLIAPVYMYALEKDGSELSVSNSYKVNPMGMSPINTSNDKKTIPISHNNASICGIDETHILAGALGTEGFLELFDTLSSTPSHLAEVQSILDSDDPMNEYTHIDRNKNPYGQAQFLKILNHIMACIGSEFVYDPEPVYPKDKVKPMPK